MNKANDQRPSVVVLVGLPASGKSTARANAIATGSARDSHIYSTDDRIDAYAAEMGKTYSEVFQEYAKVATQIANQEVDDAIARKQNVLWDQTNMTVKKRRKIINRFPKEYRLECVCILPPFNQEQEDELQRRLEGRSGKDIPDFVMKSMRNSFDLPSQNEGFNRVMYFDIYGNMVDRNQAAAMFGKG